jgi:glycosyltransferase involved in cell wall biosynthesis
LVNRVSAANSKQPDEGDAAELDPAEPTATGRQAGGEGPQVTVIMTAYNAMPYLPAAVESVFNQTLKDWLMIIIDDGSTDDTARYLDAVEDPRVRVVRQANAGQQAAANRAIEMCQTELIVRFDADDICAPDRLRNQVEFMNRHPEVGLLGGQFTYLGEAGEGVGSKLPCQHEQIYHELIHNRHAICNSMTIFRRELFERVGGYWEYNISEDWDLFLRIGEVSRLANLPQSVGRVRFHSRSINGRRMAESLMHNEFACELARRRQAGRPPIRFDEFIEQHPARRWPQSVLFKMDCHSVGQYRVAMADILNHKRIRGYSRMTYSMICSPWRTFRRIKRIFSSGTRNTNAV